MSHTFVLTCVVVLSGCGASLGYVGPENEAQTARQSIVGGQVISGEPNVFYLRMAHPTTNETLGTCTCTLIAPRTIVTASHCFSTRTMSTVPKFYVGNGQTMGTGPEIEVIERRMHPGFVDNGKISMNDIALGLLSQSPPGVIPAKIPMEDLGEIVNWPIRVIGYGRTSMQLNNSGTKRRVDTTILPSDSNIFPGCFRFGISEGEVGAHGGCPGDSGGPSFSQVNGEDAIIGVHSYVYVSSPTATRLVCGESADVRIDQYYKSFIAPWLKDKEAPVVGPAVSVTTQPAEKTLRVFVNGKSRIEATALDARNQFVSFDATSWTLKTSEIQIQAFKGGVELQAGKRAGTFAAALRFEKDGARADFDVVIEPGPVAELKIQDVGVVRPGEAVTLNVSARDAFGNMREPHVVWAANRGVVSNLGEYTAPMEPGVYSVSATEGNIASTVTIQVAGAAFLSSGDSSLDDARPPALGDVVGGCSSSGNSGSFAVLMSVVAFFLRRKNRSRIHV